jgi:hypothetical protein
MSFNTKFICICQTVQIGQSRFGTFFSKRWNFDHSGRSVWDPLRSFLRMRCEALGHYDHIRGWWGWSRTKTSTFLLSGNKKQSHVKTRPRLLLTTNVSFRTRAARSIPWKESTKFLKNKVVHKHLKRTQFWAALPDGIVSNQKSQFG